MVTSMATETESLFNFRTADDRLDEVIRSGSSTARGGELVAVPIETSDRPVLLGDKGATVGSADEIQERLRQASDFVLSKSLEELDEITARALARNRVWREQLRDQSKQTS